MKIALCRHKALLSFCTHFDTYCYYSLLGFFFLAYHKNCMTFLVRHFHFFKFKHLHYEDKTVMIILYVVIIGKLFCAEKNSAVLNNLRKDTTLIIGPIPSFSSHNLGRAWSVGTH